MNYIGWLCGWRCSSRVTPRGFAESCLVLTAAECDRSRSLWNDDIEEVVFRRVEIHRWLRRPPALDVSRSVVDLPHLYVLRGP